MEEKIFEYKMKNLIAQKTVLSNMIAVLTGGVMWLIFLDAPKYKYIPAVIGAYLVCIFVTSLMNTITELNGYLYKSKK